MESNLLAQWPRRAQSAALVTFRSFSSTMNITSCVPAAGRHSGLKMLKKAKWVPPNQSHQSASQIASSVISKRLEVVLEYAPLAAECWEVDCEYVHQLRVATRRASAALRTFEQFTPPNRAGKMLKTLKKLRRSAGEARDLDVLAARLRDEVKTGRKALRKVLAKVAHMRKRAQPAVRDAVERMERQHFPLCVRKLGERIRWRSPGQEPTYGEMAAVLLGSAAEVFFSAARADLTLVENLHALRIAGKRLRYTMELLAGAFDREFREDLYVEVREMLDQLGALNDHAAALSRFNQWAKLADPSSARREFLALAEEEASALDAAQSAFLADWKAEQWHALAEEFAAYSKVDAADQARP